MSQFQFDFSSTSPSSAISTIKEGWLELDRKVREQFHASVTIREMERSRVRQAFEEYSRNLKEQTRFSSRLADMFENPFHQKIIDLGKAVVPILIRELETDPDHWFYALYCITGENPIPDGHAGDLKAMTSDWLEWWQRNKDFYDKEDIPS